ncbi:hypothetical protein H2200_005606 [Cladophialophora chaetospira]|uniref:Thioesterase domain-containing protein n=1 Tax=Cladophialophora chaetospira TaxID=386627 RepID=A0AA39CJ30_9EURO|nr:hypothetical protein H2200_005606 [Cladophialophora chaetospira]
MAEVLNVVNEPMQAEKTYLEGDPIYEPENILLNAVEQSSTIKAFHHFASPYTVQTTRVLLKFPPHRLADQMTRASLSGPQKIACDPWIQCCDEIGALVASYYLGSKLAGHAGRIHGGLLMTLLDECMGRACFPRFAARTAVTAKIDVSFKKPVLVNSVIFVKAWTENVEGRKAWVKAEILSSEDETQPCAEASALFIEPRNAAEMDILI